MSSRLSVLLLTVCLLLGLAACSKKPETADNQQQQPPATAPDNSANAAATQSPANTPPPNPSMQMAQTPVAPAEKPAPAPKPKIVPAGTVIRVRLNDAIGSKTAQAGQTFTGSVMDPIVVDGRTLIPAGATVAGEVTNAKSAGTI